MVLISGLDAVSHYGIEILRKFISTTEKDQKSSPPQPKKRDFYFIVPILHSEKIMTLYI